MRADNHCVKGVGHYIKTTEQDEAKAEHYIKYQFEFVHVFSLASGGFVLITNAALYKQFYVAHQIK